jgi:hypothetical protein
MVTAARSRKFLLELANLRTDDMNAWRRFEELYSELLPNEVKSVTSARGAGLLGLIDDRNILLTLGEFRDGVRAVWEASDQRTREWGVFRLVEALKLIPASWSPLAVFDRVEGRIPPLPKPSALESMLRYVCTEGRRLRICPNANCPAPYFLAPRQHQRYCSESCAEFFQRQYKREWWAVNGNRWRAGRSGKKNKLT